MTTDEFIKSLDAKIKAIEKENKPLQIAVKSVMTLQSKRIFLQGKNADGAIIGRYGSKPIYISLAKSPKKFTAKGKTGKTEFKNGSKHKTGYFDNFLDYKKVIGRNERVQTVDLFLTGNLHKNWANSYVVGKADAVRINQNLYVTLLSEENVNKVERYGNVFGLSVSEKKAFYDVLKFELAKALSK